jgi:hypothetical protein
MRADEHIGTPTVVGRRVTVPSVFILLHLWFLWSL